MENTKNTTFLSVPYNILYLEGLTMSAKILLAEILSLSKLEGHCYASNAYLARRIGISQTTVKESIKVLKKKGYITSKTLNTKERFIYPCQAGIRPDSGAESDRKQDGKRPRNRAKSDHNNNIYNTNYNTNYKERANSKRDYYMPREASYDIEELMKIK